MSWPGSSVARWTFSTAGSWSRAAIFTAGTTFCARLLRSMDRDLGFLVDILIAARDLLEFKQGTTKDEFLRSKLLRSAILHQLVVIGEASRRLSEEFRGQNSEIPWHQVIAL